MKTIKEKIAVMQAFMDGKEIQLRHLNDSKYYDCKKPGWNWDSYDYIVKEEPKKPEYVPFTFQDAELWMTKPIKEKGGSTEFMMIELIFESRYRSYNSKPLSFETFLNNYTFLDGSPCGKLKQ